MYVFLPSGQMLMNWLASSFQALPLTLNDQVLNIIAQQYCTNLLAVGVINQIPDKYAPIQDTFKVRE
jgi:formin 2